jgi:hypothetical protein
MRTLFSFLLGAVLLLGAATFGLQSGSANAAANAKDRHDKHNRQSHHRHHRHHRHRGSPLSW